MEILYNLAINSFIIIGIHVLFTEDMVFGAIGDKIRRLGDYTYDKLKIDISKPLVVCPPCMASVWGTLYFFGFTDLAISIYLVYIIALCGLNYILYAITF